MIPYNKQESWDERLHLSLAESPFHNKLFTKAYSSLSPTLPLSHSLFPSHPHRYSYVELNSFPGDTSFHFQLQFRNDLPVPSSWILSSLFNVQILVCLSINVSYTFEKRNNKHKRLPLLSFNLCEYIDIKLFFLVNM